MMYASPALSLNYKQVDELNVCWNSVIRRIFGYQRSESVKDVMNRYALGGLNVKHLLLLRRVKFYYHLYRRSDVLHNLFWASLLTVLMMSA